MDNNSTSNTCLGVWVYRHVFLPFFQKMGTVALRVGAGNFQYWGVPLIWIITGQGPTVHAVTVHAVSVGEDCLNIFSCLSFLFSFSLFL